MQFFDWSHRRQETPPSPPAQPHHPHSAAATLSAAARWAAPVAATDGLPLVSGTASDPPPLFSKAAAVGGIGGVVEDRRGKTRGELRRSQAPPPHNPPRRPRHLRPSQPAEASPRRAVAIWMTVL